jgi:hypothetical protein
LIEEKEKEQAKTIAAKSRVGDERLVMPSFELICGHVQVRI